MRSRFAPHLLLTVLLALAHGGLARAGAAPLDSQRELLERLTGDWVLRGTIAKQEVTHDLSARWVLDRGYVQIHELSREQDAEGKPEYEAIVYVTWVPELGEYACLWLDSTGVAAFPPDGVGHAQPEPDRIAFVFGGADDGIHNTFAYDRSRDEWTWSIDNASEGVRTPFARVVLTRE
jgi:hypothetical protein